MRYDTVIKGGNVVTPAGAFAGDVAIRGEQIVALGTELDAENARVIDARGHHVIPGVLDVHVHLELPFYGSRRMMFDHGFGAGGLFDELDEPPNGNRLIVAEVDALTDDVGGS